MSLAIKIAKNTAWLTLGKIISTGAGILTVALLLRYLSPDDYGRYTTVLAFILLLGTITDFGLNLTTTQDISLPENDTVKTLSSVFTFRLLANLALATLLPLILKLFPYELIVKQSILILITLFFSTTLFQVLASYFQKTLQAGKVALAETTGKILLLVLTLLAINFRFSFLNIILTIALSSLCQLWMIIHLLNKEIKLELIIDWQIWKRIISKTWPIAISVVLTTIYFKGDTIILSLTRPYQEVGIYGAAYKILEVLITLPILFMGLVLPQLSNSFATDDKERFNRVLQKSWDGLSLFTLPLIAGTIILAKPIIKLIAGTSYEAATVVLQILIVATGIIFLGSLFTHTVVAVNQQKNMIIYYALAALLALGLYLYFIPIYTYYAAAIITVICELLIAIAAFYKVRQKTYFKLSLNIFIKALTASLIMATILKIFYTLPLIILFIIGIFVYGAILWITKTIPKFLLS